jgi:CrcB protein
LTEPIALKALAVFVGAGAGGVARWLIGSAVQGRWAGEGGFPIGTLVVNVTGCLLIGIVAAALLEGGPGTGRGLRLFGEPGRESGVLWMSLLMVGVLGGYTTFSSFGLESLMLARQERWGMLGLYVLLSNTLGLAAVWGGWSITRAVVVDRAG